MYDLAFFSFGYDEWFNFYVKNNIDFIVIFYNVFDASKTLCQFIELLNSMSVHHPFNNGLDCYNLTLCHFIEWWMHTWPLPWYVVIISLGCLWESLDLVFFQHICDVVYWGRICQYVYSWMGFWSSDVDQITVNEWAILFPSNFFFWVFGRKVSLLQVMLRQKALY